MRNNGIISYPEKLSEATTQFASGALAASPMFRAYSRKLRGGTEAERKLKAELDKDAAWFKRKKLKSVKGTYLAKIKVDLSDLGSSYPTKKMEQMNPYVDLKINTSVNPSDSLSNALAYFSGGSLNIATGKLSRINLMAINLPIIASTSMVSGAPMTLGNYRRIKRQVAATVQHEFQHFIQNALLDVVSGKKEWAKDDYVKARDELGLTAYKDPPNDAYLLKKVEYFPWLGDILTTVRFGADRANKARRHTKPFLLDIKSFNGFIHDSLERDSFTDFILKLKRYSPDRYQRYRVERTAFINDYNEAVLTRRQQQRYLTPQRVVSEVLLDLDTEDRSLAAWLRQNREWAEKIAKESL
jgi:hypothetical protein